MPKIDMPIVTSRNLTYASIALSLMMIAVQLISIYHGR